MLLGEHRSADLRASCSFDDGAAQRIGHRASIGFPSLGRHGRSMSGKGSVTASAIGRRDCGAAAACRRADKNNKEGPWQALKQESSAYRWYGGSLDTRARWLVLRSIEAASQTCVTSGGDSGKINRRAPI